MGKEKSKLTKAILETYLMREKKLLEDLGEENQNTQYGFAAKNKILFIEELLEVFDWSEEPRQIVFTISAEQKEEIIKKAVIKAKNEIYAENYKF